MDEQQPQPASGWEFKPEGDNIQAEYEAPAQREAISWTASEFIAHEKGLSWYVIFGVVTALLTLITYFVTHEVISPIIILIVAIAFAVFAARSPRTLPYQIDSHGVHIDQKTYPYEVFKSFSLIQEGGIRSVVLMPLKRFMPPLSLYMDPADEEKIVDVLADYLPVEQREQDPIDKLMRRLRF
jgi:hypothetical protein